MQFGLTESQVILRDSARKFFAGECPMAEVRRLMETETAYDAKLWAKLAEQGYTGIIFAEEFGGVGLGIVELILLLEEAGRALLPGPFFTTVVQAGALLDAAGSRGAEEKISWGDLPGESRGLRWRFWRPGPAGIRRIFGLRRRMERFRARNCLFRTRLQRT